MKTTITITNKDLEWSGLMKLPDEVVIKQLRRDLGSANTYVEELEERIKLMECQSKLAEYKQLMKEKDAKLHEYKQKLAWYRRIYGQLPSDNIEMDEK